jgi:hypothetical protein
LKLEYGKSKNLKRRRKKKKEKRRVGPYNKILKLSLSEKIKLNFPSLKKTNS